MKRVVSTILAGLAFLALPVCVYAQTENPTNQAPSPAQIRDAARQLEELQQQLNGRKKRAPVKVPDPVPFVSKDKRLKGWKVVIPGNRPLATPAVANGRVFIGGGFGSHEFYAFDAYTGKKIWQYQTADDGPTAAVVHDDLVVFNTESCEIEVLTVDGKPVWKKWLGDPLMSMPAVAAGQVFMSYPDSKHKSRPHYVTCLDLKSGKEQWKQPIPGAIITAPVIQEGKVLLTCLEGTVFCFEQKDGALVWKEKKNATSAPLICNDRCYFSQRCETVVSKNGELTKQQVEQVANRLLAAKASIIGLAQTRNPADYLDYEKRKSRSSRERDQTRQDIQVGFGNGKGDAKIQQAQRNLGLGNVAGVWAYQGSKPFAYKNHIYSAMGDMLKCVNPETEKVVWAKMLHDREPEKELLDSVLTPPALVNDKVFLGTSKGEVYCLSSQTGKVVWKVKVGEPVLCQPTVVNGRVYVSTSKGSLICLQTGDAKDDGWQMWGANPAHNGQLLIDGKVLPTNAR